MDNSEQFEAVAIIGMAGRFPGAVDISEFWQNVSTGTESISFFSDEQLLSAGVDASLLARPEFVRAAGVLADADLFDAGLFGVNPREAELLDPQHRVFLETAWQALEDAAYDSERYEGAIGVYAGVSLNSYFLHNVLGNRELLDQVGGFQAVLSSDKDFLPMRVSYKLNLRGPSVTVQTACSTSLVAVHIACQALLGGECDIALAGGVSVSVPQESGYVYQEGGVASPDGHCRAFDAAAKGTVSGNGVGVVVLKRLSEAVADGDRIYAVIKGTAINNDGSDKIGYTAPSTNGQAEVIAQVLAIANVKPETVTYIEAHGTGTELGDPIEVAALTQVFRASTEQKQYCALGSVKTNVGHLDTAAGVAGLIKTALALQHRQIPPSLHFEQPNPRIDFAQSPFYVNTELRPWTRNGRPLRAGVSSFGIGGTNAHAVLEEAPARAESTEPVREWQLLVLSGRSEAVLEAMSEQLAEHLLAHPEQRLADVAYTLQSGRRVMPHKRAVLCRSSAEATAALQARDGRMLSGVQEQKGRAVVLMFPGQGAQYLGMGAALYEREAVYRREFDRCDEVLRGQLGFSLAQLLYGGGSESATVEQELQQTRVTQPALFAVEYALARQLLHWGVKVAGMMGHSVGEYVAACLAGVFTLEEGLRLVALRGRLMQAMQPGVMLSVGLGEAAVQRWLRPGLSLAAINSAQLSVVSGAAEAVSELEQELTAADVWSRRLRTSHAFHSELMAPAAQQLVKAVEQVKLRAPQQRFISNVSGEWIKAAEAMSAAYWGRQMREPVRFWDGLQEVLKEGGKLLVEAGPGRGLSVLAREAAQGVAESAVVRTMRSAEEEGDAQEWLQRGVGQLWVQGGQLSWEKLREGEVRRREQVPGYAFERERFWIERAQTQPDEEQERGKIVKRTDIADWFYVPSWKRSSLLKEAGSNNEERLWLILLDERGVGRVLSEKLLKQNQRVLTVSIGERFAREDETAFSLDPREPEHYRQLFSVLHAEIQLPHKILHLWGLSEAEPQSFEEAQSRGLYSLLYLTQAVAEVGLEQDVELEVVTTQTQEVSGAEQLRAEKATVLGACKVIPQEHSRLQCRAIDVELNGGGAQVLSRVAEQLLAEVSERIGPRVVAYRGAHRWEQSYERVRVAAGREGRRLRRGGVYLITGGLGGVGQALAGYLAAEAGAKLVLVSRSGGEGASRAEAVQRLEELGAEVLVLRADVSDEQEMRAAVEQTLERFGKLNGVIHAAGIAGGAIIDRLDSQILQRAFEAKIKGTLVLDHLLNDVDLDFLLLCSSHRSILGGLGRVDYAAANAFLDVYARAEHRGKSRYVVSVNWDTWRDVGMAVEAARQHSLDPAEAIQEGLYAAEGVEAFTRILNTNLPQVIVSPEDFQTRVKESESLSAAKMLEELEKQSASRTAATEVKLHVRPELSTQYLEPRNEVEQTLSGIWEKILGIAPIGVQDNYLELGGDSVLSIQIVARANQAGLKLAPRHMFEHQTIEALAAVAGTTAKLKAEQGVVSGVAPLTPIQHWFFEQELADAHHYNQAVMLEMRSSISIDGLREVVGKILLHHDALRMRFKRKGSDWQQENAKYEDADVLQLIDVSEMPEGKQRAEIEAHAQQVQKKLDFEQGPLMRVVLYKLGAGNERRLLVVVHHLVIDAVSWGILLEDLQRGCEQFKRGDAIDFGAKTTSYREWGESLEKLARNGAVDDEMPYWAAAARSYVGRMPLDCMDGSNDAGSVDVVKVSLEEEETISLLQQVGKAYNTSVEEALLTALREAYEQWTGQDRLLVDVEGHGREEIEDGVDVTRTVGWFTSIYPVLLENQEDTNIGKKLAAVKETMRQVKRSGLGYGMLRYLGSESEKLKQLPEAEIIFLYLGQLDRVIGDEGDLGVASETAGESRSARGKRKHLLEIISAVTGGKLEVSWNYSKNFHSRETIEKLAGDHVEFLRELIMHCQSPDAKGYTPSDFPEVSLTQAELDALIARLG